MANVFFGDRIGRLSYFLWMLAIGIVLSPIQIYVGRNLYGDEASTVLLLTRIICVGVAVFPTIKRLHDLNQSGWLWLLGLIPIVNFFFGIYLLFGKGTDGANDYGEPPEEPIKNTQIGSSSIGSRFGDRAFGGEVAKEVKMNSIIVSRSDDDKFYDEVAKELESKKLVSGMWTRAFAEADGDENRAKAIYIKRRVAELAEICRQQLEEAKLRAEQLAENSRRQLEEAKRTAMLDARVVSREVVNDRWVRNTYTNGDVTMSDKNTGLMWLYNANPCGRKKWSDAVAYCNKLTYAGYSDWRLPSKDTLEAQFSQKGFFAGVQKDYYWSDTSQTGITGGAWYVYMSNGYADYSYKTNSNYVWPVRGGQ